MNKKIRWLIIIVLLAALLHVARILLLSFEQGTRIDPYHETEWVYNEEYEEVRPLYYQTDVHALLRVHRREDILQKRENLIHFLWGKEGFPSSQISVTREQGIIDVRYAHPYLENHAKRAYWLNQFLTMTWGMKWIVYPVMRMTSNPNLRRIDKLTVEMEHGLNSVIYHFVPIHANNTLIIYHQGHRGDFILGKEIIWSLVKRGYDVIALSMPLYGMNNQPEIVVDGIGILKFSQHDHLKFLPLQEGHPVKHFLEPVAAIVNEAQQFHYDRICMIGISGGGWTTTLYAAIDPRIVQSYPVAGSLPIFLRTQRDWGDYEQTVPELYQIANYLEFYLLGAYGEHRKQVQILNQYDSCCFGGKAYTLYEQILQKKIADLGTGTFKVHLDSSHHEHKISKSALGRILHELNKQS